MPPDLGLMDEPKHEILMPAHVGRHKSPKLGASSLSYVAPGPSGLQPEVNRCRSQHQCSKDSTSVVRTQQVAKDSAARGKSHGRTAQVSESLHQRTMLTVTNNPERPDFFDDEDITVEVINEVPGNIDELDISVLESFPDNHAETGKRGVKIASVF